jgi:hypothetical protein
LRLLEPITVRSYMPKRILAWGTPALVTTIEAAFNEFLGTLRSRPAETVAAKSHLRHSRAIRARTRTGFMAGAGIA